MNCRTSDGLRDNGPLHCQFVRSVPAETRDGEGEMVWREDPVGEANYMSTPRTIAWVEALPAEAQKAYRHFM